MLWAAGCANIALRASQGQISHFMICSRLSATTCGREHVCGHAGLGGQNNTFTYGHADYVATGRGNSSAVVWVGNGTVAEGLMGAGLGGMIGSALGFRVPSLFIHLSKRGSAAGAVTSFRI